MPPGGGASHRQAQRDGSPGNWPREYTTQTNPTRCPEMIAEGSGQEAVPIYSHPTRCCQYVLGDGGIPDRHSCQKNTLRLTLLRGQGRRTDMNEFAEPACKRAGYFGCRNGSQASWLLPNVHIYRGRSGEEAPAPSVINLLRMEV